ncbi:MAG: CHAT domain-containing protein [Nitrososphaeraceae archaeon]
MLRRNSFIDPTQRFAMITILFLSANPTATDPLELIKECNIINQKLKAAANKGDFKLEQRHDISIKWLIEELLNYNPQILHFSGHGSPNSSLIFKNEDTGEIEEVPPSALSNLFRILGNKIDLVFLNACYSEKQAQAISKHVNCVIGMSKEVSDKAAIEFASTFYSSLGFGKSVKEAFELAKVQLELLGIPESETPDLKVKEGMDPSKIVIPAEIQNGPPNICDKLEVLKQNHQKLLMQKMTIGELFQTIVDPISNFLSDPVNKKKIGEVQSNALNLLLINLGGKVRDYNNYMSIGNDDKARIVENQSMVVVRDIIQKLDEICI